MTLVELLIYSLLLVVILGIAGSIIISTISSQRTVQTVGSAASAGQLVSGSVEVGIRNASAFQVAAPTALGQLLRSRTLDITDAGVSTWTCRAWFRTAGGDFYTKNANAIIPAPAVAADLSTWRLITSGVGLPTGTAQAFTASGSQLAIALSIAAASAKPVLIKTTILSQTQTDTGTAPTTCF
jgi:hypothetical protein